jgi:hypothetical protein
VLLLPCCVCSWLLPVSWIRNLSLDDSRLIWLVVLLQKTLMLGSTPSSGRIHWRGSTSGAWRTAVVMAMVVDSVAPKRGCTGSPLLEKRCGFWNHLSHMAAILCYKLSASRSRLVFFLSFAMVFLVT